MSSSGLLRALLLAIQVPCYQLASTPPNKTPSSGRYDHVTPWHLRIAAVVMQLQQPVILICALADLALIVSQQSLLPQETSQFIQSSICPFPSASPSPPSSLLTTQLNNTHLQSHPPPLTPSSSSSPSPSSSHLFPFIHANTYTLLGLLLVAFGSYLRLTCFKALGNLFTFDLSIMPHHKLITWGPYSFVRHPAYSGSLCIMLGLALINLTRGGWIVECGVLGFGSEVVGQVIRVLLFGVWYSWWISVGVHRAELEDGQLKKLFGKEWETYSRKVTCWFVPGIF